MFLSRHFFYATRSQNSATSLARSWGRWRAFATAVVMRGCSVRLLRAYKPTWRGTKPACAHHCAAAERLWHSRCRSACQALHRCGLLWGERLPRRPPPNPNLPPPSRSTDHPPRPRKCLHPPRLGQGRPGTGAALWASLFQRAMLQRAPCWCYIFHGPCSATVTWTKWASPGGRIRGFLKTRTWTAFSSNMTCPPTWRSQWNQGMCGCGFNDARFEIHHRRDIHLLHFSHAQMIQHLVLKRQAIFSLAKELIKQLSSVWGQVGHLHRQLAAPLKQLLPKLPAARKWYASVQLDSVNGFPFESKNSNHDLFHSIYNDRKGTTL